VKLKEKEELDWKGSGGRGALAFRRAGLAAWLWRTRAPYPAAKHRMAV